MNSTTDHKPRASKADMNVCAVCGQPVMRRLEGVRVRSSKFVLGHATAEEVAHANARAAAMLRAIGR